MSVRDAGDFKNSGLAPLELGQNSFFDRPWQIFNRKGIAQLHL